MSTPSRRCRRAGSVLVAALRHAHRRRLRQRCRIGGGRIGGGRIGGEGTAAESVTSDAVESVTTDADVGTTEAVAETTAGTDASEGRSR